MQRLARQAVRDVREAVAGGHAPSVDAELAAAEAALRSVGIKLSVDNTAASIDPAHETTIAWALREAVTKRSSTTARASGRIVLEANADAIFAHQRSPSTTMVVVRSGKPHGTGRDGLWTDRVHALGGTLEVAEIPLYRGTGIRGFRLRVRLGAAAPPGPHAEIGP